jgi:hypothetical protein
VVVVVEMVALMALVGWAAVVALEITLTQR